MKRLLFSLFILSIIISCQENEIVNPTTHASTNTSATYNAEGLADPNSKRVRVTPPNGSAAYTMASYVPEELYAARNNTMLAIDATTGSNYLLNPDMPFMYHMASIGGFIYGILNDHLYKIDPSTGVFNIIGTGWSGAEGLTAGWAGVFLKKYIFGVQGGNLWKFDLATNTRISMGSGWGGTKGMTFGNNHIYIALGDQLRVVNATSGSVAVLDPSGWSGVKTMAFYNNYIYSFRTAGFNTGQLWKTWHNGGSSIVAPAQGFYNVANGLTYYGSSLYVLSGHSDLSRELLRINPANGSATYMISVAGGTAMTGRY